MYYCGEQYQVLLQQYADLTKDVISSFISLAFVQDQLADLIRSSSSHSASSLLRFTDASLINLL